MIRLFLSPEIVSSDTITIRGDEARYLSLVLRIIPGEHLTIYDGTGFQYTCRVLEVHKKEVIVEKVKKEACSAESPISITLVQGLPKSDKMDFIIQKATELGVSKIIPLITERSQVRHTEKAERWRKIAISASQQSGRERMPVIEEIVEFQSWMTGQALHDTVETPHARILFYEEYKKRNLKKIVTGLEGIKSITLLIGPEGGFSKEEISAAVQRGFVGASLGPRILRTETAPIAAISIIQYALGDMG